MEEIERYCDRVIVLKAGEVVANDSPKSLIKKYNKEFFTDVYFHLVEGGA
jgi:ABC-2 type transport system ATP-binding protein